MYQEASTPMPYTLRMHNEWRPRLGKAGAKIGFVIISVVSALSYALLAWASSHNFDLVASANIIFWALTTLSLLFMVGVLRHITAREEELADMRADFVAVASHELRSPLSAVRWYLSQLRSDTNLSQDARTITNDLYDRICKLIDLTTTFFLMTSADQIQAHPEEMKVVDIAPALRDVFEHSIATARAKNIKVEMQGSLETSILMKADPARLRIVFDNLLSNAIKYSHNGSKVLFTYHDLGATKQFAIHDTGIGVPKKEVEKIFSGYHRASNAKRSGALGSGFGLYMAKKIIDMHGGTISCHSDANGTTFLVALPVAN
jgi:two-component system, OmpR family, sensor histidine kinase VanS